MSAPVIKAQYDSLEQIAVQFDEQANNSEKMARHLIQTLEQLERGGWEGDAAKAFFYEMSDEVIPAANRLRDAFMDGGATTREIVTVIQAAEQEAANQFLILENNREFVFANQQVVDSEPEPPIRPIPSPEGGQSDGRQGEDEKGFWGGVWDGAGEWVHGGLDVVGLIPGFGEAADGINGLIYLAEGRNLEAGLSFGAMVPFVGWGATAGKVGVRVTREVAEEGVERLVREGVEDGVERVVREGADDAAGGIRRIADDPPPTKTVTNGHKSVKDPTFLKAGELVPNTSYSRNGYDYVTDANGRVSEISGNLRLEEYPRYRDYETKVGNMGKTNDDGGHLIANRFGGVSEGVNLVPQNSNLNRGDWKTMENKWADALKEVPPKNVEVNIKTIYSKDGIRPDSFVVKYKVGDGPPISRIFENKPGG